MINRDHFPKLPKSWSALTWQQLKDCWQVKMQYSGNADVARAAALLALTFGSRFKVQGSRVDDKTGEPVYYLQPETRNQKPETYVITPRELSQMAQQALPWFDYPYGDPGKPVVKDEKGNVIEEAVNPVRGYVSEMRDAMILPQQELEVDGMLFALPQMACNNLTWQQYRSLQALVPMLFQEGISEEDALDMQSQFLAQILIPARDTQSLTDPFAPSHAFVYNTERAEQTVAFWKKRLKKETTAAVNLTSALFHICFQTYQTAITYYAGAYPLLFSDDKNDTMKDALQGEVGTINTIMKYAGYAEQQQVYDSNLPFVLDILNTMTKEAKEIEKMNAKIKHKK